VYRAVYTIVRKEMMMMMMKMVVVVKMRVRMLRMSRLRKSHIPELLLRGRKCLH